MPVAMDRLPSPMEIVRELDRVVRGQQRAKRDLACCAYRHYMTAAYRERHPQFQHPFGKRHVLMLGPTGAGKTHLVRSLTAILGVPLAFASATNLVEAGYVGEHIDTVFRRLYLAANRDATAAARGIIYVDEIDKIRRQDVGGQRDVSGEGVQTSMLTPLDGCPVEIRTDDVRVTIDSSNVLFICTGAFGGLAETIRQRLGSGRTLGFSAKSEDVGPLSDDDALARGEIQDLEAYGFIPEFLGRFAVISTVKSLTRDDLVAILRDIEESPLARQKRWFQQHGVDLQVTDDALVELANGAIRNGTNARGLERTLAKMLARLEWRLPELAAEGICRVTVTREVVLGSADPVMHQTGSTHIQPAQPSIELRREAQQLLSMGRAATAQRATPPPLVPLAIPSIRRSGTRRTNESKSSVRRALTNIEHGSAAPSTTRWLRRLRLAVTANQCIRGTVVIERGFRCRFQLRDNPLRQDLAQFDAPLVERADVPDDALGEHEMFVKSHQRPE